MIKRVFGFGLYLIGLVLAILSRAFCGKLCNNFCNEEYVSTCSFLFLFVSVVFIVNATCLIIERKITK